MRPKEIVYLSFGTPANAVSTHFWNTQQDYFEYGCAGPAPAAPPPVVDHDVSFREGVGTDGHPTYTPRAIFFDTREEFGTLRERCAMYADVDVEEALGGWYGDVVAQPRVPASWYAGVLDGEDEAMRDDERPQGRARTSGTGTSPARPPPLRYWSDYGRVHYHPRSLVHVGASTLFGTTFLQGRAWHDADAEPAVHTSQFASFEQGVAVARTMEEEQQVCEERIRWFAEDSDLLQGFQATATSSDAFAGLSAAYLDLLADEYPKTSRLVAAYAPTRVGKSQSCRLAAMNDVLALAHLGESASLLVPLHMEREESAHVRPVWTDLREESALLSTYVETATLALRLRARDESMAGLTSRLNWRRDTPIAQLGGCVPTPPIAPLHAPSDPADILLEQWMRAKGAADPSARTPPPDGAALLAAAWRDCSHAYGGARASRDTTRPPPYAEAAVARDSNAPAAADTAAALTAWNAAPASLTKTAYPSIFYGLTPRGRPQSAPSASMPAVPTAVRELPTTASLYTTPDTHTIVRAARNFVQRVLNGHEPLALYGVGASGAGGCAASAETEGYVGGRDGLREIRERLEGWCSAYAGGVVSDEEGPGTDEEWGDMEEWE
ncbi:mtDNA inheritance, partitioning of the mitochondrial organelle [Malassezia sp. CBS 17886]|nr:mtDNA inheritance, partitioning of the mitochondrial organelle [Malassezia sp. CBS 17886]